MARTPPNNRVKASTNIKPTSPPRHAVTGYECTPVVPVTSISASLEALVGRNIVLRDLDLSGKLPGPKNCPANLLLEARRKTPRMPYRRCFLVLVTPTRKLLPSTYPQSELLSAIGCLRPLKSYDQPLGSAAPHSFPRVLLSDGVIDRH